MCSKSLHACRRKWSTRASCAISQSGETADTLAALCEVKMKRALAFGVVNVVESTLSRETDAGVYLHVGAESGWRARRRLRRRSRYWR